MALRTAMVMERGPAAAAAAGAPVVFAAAEGGHTARSVWTCVIEAAAEYCSTVFDLFPEHPLVAVSVAGQQHIHHLAKWADKDRSLASLLKAAAALPALSVDGPEPDLEAAVTEAIEALAGEVKRGKAPGVRDAQARSGRLVIFHTRDSSDLVSLVERAVQARSEAANALSFLEIHAIQTKPGLAPADAPPPTLPSKPTEFLNPHGMSVALTRLDVHAAVLRPLLQHVVLDDFSLSHARIVGIPIQTQGQQDVSGQEISIIFPNADHAPDCKQLTRYPAGTAADLESAGKGSKKAAAAAAAVAAAAALSSSSASAGDASAASGIRQRTENILAFNKHSGAQAFLATNDGAVPAACAHRVTPLVTAESEPIIECLLTHFRDGKAVLLVDGLAKKGATLKKSSPMAGATHMLVPHRLAEDADVAIYLHCLRQSQTLMGSVPSIEKCAGGAISDYRLEDLKEITTRMLVKPAPGKQRPAEPPAVVTKLEQTVARETKVFPLNESSTIAFAKAENPAVQQLTSFLLSKLSQNVLPDSALTNCTEALQRLYEAKVQNAEDFFPGVKGKKRATKYKKLWKEMVKIVTAYSDSSSAHGKALTYLQNLDATGGMKAAAVSEWDKVDQIESMTEREIQDMNTGDTNNSHFGGRGPPSAAAGSFSHQSDGDGQPSRRRKFFKDPNVRGLRPSDTNINGVCLRGDKCRFEHVLDPAAAPPKSGSGNSLMICFTCGQRGHRAAECPELYGNTKSEDSSEKKRRRLSAGKKEAADAPAAEAKESSAVPPGGNESLLAIWTGQLTAKQSRRVFAGYDS